MISDTIARLKEMEKNETAGPWEVRPMHVGRREIGAEIVGNIHDGWNTPVAKSVANIGHYHGNKEFIVTLRNAFPELVAEIERLNDQHKADRIEVEKLKQEYQREMAAMERKLAMKGPPA